MDQMVMRPPVRLSFGSELPFQLLDITDSVADVGADAALRDGIVHVFCPHTSCGLAVTELEAGLHEDFERVLEQLTPVAGPWAHDDMSRRYQNIEPDERRNGWSHVRGLLGTLPFVTVPIVNGTIALGQWQRLFLVELDGPRSERTVLVQAWGRPA